MRVLKISDELSSKYLRARDSYECARKALLTSLPDLDTAELHKYYVNAYKDLCDRSIELCTIENEILTVLNITGFRSIELNSVYVEDEDDNRREN